MKQFTLKELSNLTNIPTNTIRRWLLKPVVGQVYNKEIWNQVEMKNQLKKYELDFVKILGCKVEEVECIKSSRSLTKTYIELDEVKVNQTIVLHNYSLETTLKLVEVRELNGTKLYTFYNDDKDEYRTYSLDQLSRKNIKIESIEE